MPVWNMLGPRPIKLTITKYGFAHVYKLTTYLVSLEKVSLYNKIPLLIVSKNCLGKQFTKKFLGTCTTNGSLKIVLCSIVQEPATEVFTPFSRKVLTN